MKLFRRAVMTTVVLVITLSGCTQESSPATQTPPTASPATEISPPPSPAPLPFKLTSPAFEANAFIPSRHTCHGENLSPALAWSAPPPGTQSLVLVIDDPDAVGVVGKVWDHWVVFNVPADVLSLPEGTPPQEEMPDGSRQGRNSSNGLGYSGPCPPPGQTHGYVFSLYAVDSLLTLEPRATKDAVLQAIEGHILAQAQLVGQYASP